MHICSLNVNSNGKKTALTVMLICLNYWKQKQRRSFLDVKIYWTWEIKNWQQYFQVHTDKTVLVKVFMCFSCVFVVMPEYIPSFLWLSVCCLDCLSLQLDVTRFVLLSLLCLCLSHRYTVHLECCVCILFLREVFALSESSCVELKFHYLYGIFGF